MKFFFRFALVKAFSAWLHERTHPEATATAEPTQPVVDVPRAKAEHDPVYDSIVALRGGQAGQTMVAGGMMDTVVTGERQRVAPQSSSGKSRSFDLGDMVSRRCHLFDIAFNRLPDLHDWPIDRVVGRLALLIDPADNTVFEAFVPIADLARVEQERVILHKECGGFCRALTAVLQRKRRNS